MTYNDHRDFMDKFLSEQDVRPNTLIKYRNVMKLWIEWMIVHGISMGTATKADFVVYKNELYGRKLSTLTINTYMSVIRKYYRWLEENNEYKDITKNIRGFKRYDGFRKRPVSIQDVVKLLGAPDKSTKHGMRDYLMMRMMLEAGFRSVEMERMDVGDFIRGDHPGIMVLGKGEYEKVFTRIPVDLAMEIEKFTEGRMPEEPLWKNTGPNNNGSRFSRMGIGQMIKGYVKQTGLDKKISAHSLRHTTAVMMIKSGASLFEAQAQLRHKNADMTRNYLRFYEEESRKLSKVTDNVHEVIENALEHKEEN